jgi:hypothetical protein
MAEATCRPPAWTPTVGWVSVWPTGQTDQPGQLAAGGYLPATAADTAGLPPAVAAHAVRAYTRPGQTVLDPDCGAGTVLVEAVHAGRHAIGRTGRRWWPVARANLTAAKHAGAAGDGMVLDRQPATGPPAGLAAALGPVDLILTTLRPDPTEPRRRPPTRRLPGTGPTGPSSPAADRLADLLAGCRPLLRPGGHAVVIAGPVRRAGRLVDLPNVLGRAARQAGLVPVDRCLALTAPLPSQAPAAGWRPAGTHLTVYVFHAPPDPDQAGTPALPAPAPVSAPRLAAGGQLEAELGWAA